MQFHFSRIALAVVTGLVSSLALATLPTQAQTPGPLVTEFRCVTAQKNFATIAARGTRTTPPMILWTKSQGGLSAQQRCQMVTANLNQAVQRSGGRLSRLSLTTGVVNSSQVICSVRSAQQACNPENVILTLRPTDNPQEVLQQIRDFSIRANTPPITRGTQNNDIYDFGLAVDTFLNQPEATSSPSTP
jgi:hypothetical protein